MQHAKPRQNTLRRNLWRSMRIMMNFTIHQLAATSGASYGNARKFVAALRRHGYIIAGGNYTGGRSGDYQQYRLIGMNGPDYPTVCARCGGILSGPCGTETETGRERETETESGERLMAKGEGEKPAALSPSPLALSRGGES